MLPFKKLYWYFMKNRLDIVATITLLTYFVLASYGYGRTSILDVAQYKETGESQINWEQSVYDGVTQVAMVPTTHNLVGSLSASHNYTLHQLKVINTTINNMFGYSSNKFNIWHAQSVEETLTLGTGDCKAYAMYKWNVLRQLGYRNVKIISVLVANGRGRISGYVVTLLNDVIVFDINDPYIYPYAYLRANNGVERMYNPNGVWLVKGGESDGEETRKVSH
jgi:predicted transglutaminase-like cysteine proteinase